MIYLICKNYAEAKYFIIINSEHFNISYDFFKIDQPHS